MIAPFDRLSPRPRTPPALAGAGGARFPVQQGITGNARRPIDSAALVVALPP